MAPTARGDRKTPLDHDPESVRWALDKVNGKQSWLAEQIGIKPGHMSEILSGKRNAPPHLLRLMAQAMNCPISVLERKREHAA